MAWLGSTTSGSNPKNMSSAAKSAVEDKGKEVEMKVKAIGSLRCFFSLSSPSLYPPAPHLWIFVLNFTIHHGDSAVSAFVSSSAAAHRPPLAFHRPHIPTYLRILGQDP